MKKWKKTALTISSYVAVAALAVGGTVALFTDTDEDVNVMTVGNVKIEQHEQDRDGNDFEQDQVMMPIVTPASTKDDAGYPACENYVDKIVTVENTGRSDAYVRTIIAIPSYDYEGNKENNASTNVIHWNGYSVGDAAPKFPAATRIPGTDINVDNEWSWGVEGGPVWPGNNDGWNCVEDVVIAGQEYTLYVITHTGILEPEEISAPNMTGLYLDSNVDYDGEKYTINGNEIEGFDGNVEVLVATQAVQASGFDNAWDALDEAFDAISTTNHPWIDGVYSADTSWYDENKDEFTISTANELFGLAELVNSGKTTFSGKTVKLGADINLAGSEWTPIGKVPEGEKNTDFSTSFKGTFDGEGYTVSNITVNNEKHAGLFGLVHAGSISNVNVENVNITTKHWAGGVVGYLYGSKAGSNSIITNCSAKNVTINCVDETGVDGDKAGGIVGWIDGYLSTNYNVSNNSVDNVVITANRDAGAIAGYVKERSALEFENNTFENVTVTWSNYGTGANLSNEAIGRS